MHFSANTGLLVWIILLKKDAFGLTCRKCEETTDSCNVVVGILKVATRNEKIILEKVLEFINQTQTQILYFPLDEDKEKLADSSGWGLVGPIGENILKSNVSALIGPDRSLSVAKIHPYTVVKDIPHIAPIATSIQLDDKDEFPHIIRIVSSTSYQIQALLSTMRYHSYNHFSVIYVNQNIFQEQYNFLWLGAKKSNLKQRVWHQINVPVDDDLEAVRSMLTSVMEYLPHALVLLVNSQIGKKVLIEAHKMGITPANGWMLFVLDSISSEDLVFTITEANFTTFDGVTAIRPVSSGGKLLKNFKEFLEIQSIDIEFDYQTQKYADSLLLFVTGLRNVCKNSSTQNEQVVDVSEFTEGILLTNISGFSEDISFDENGRIFLPSFDILQSLNTKWIKVGKWIENQLKMDDEINLNLTASSDVMFHLDVVTIIERPFVYFKEDYEVSSHARDVTNDLEGYCIDLLKELSKRIGFSFQLNLVDDGQFGSYEAESQSWTGIVGELERGEADLAVASITATKERSDVIDFLPSVFDVGLKFIYNVTTVEGENEEYSPFAFLFPFNISLYSGILISVSFMACFLCLLSKLSPYGIRGIFFLSPKADQLQYGKNLKLSHRAKRQLEEDKKEAERGMGLNNSLYFVWAALFWQTPERVPRSVSARVATVTWYLAAVVFLASYTANMVAVISAHRDQTSIESLSDLMMQTEVQYGTVVNSAVEATLGQSDVLLAKRLHKLLWQNPSERFVPSFEAGLALVGQSQYSLIWDSVSLDYAAIRTQCELKTIDVGFGSGKYAFATRKNSSHFNALSSHLYRLKEQGVLNRLYNKYFTELHACDSVGKSGNRIPHQLTFSDLAGIFYLVGFSMAVGLVLLLGEWFMVALNDVNSNDPTAPTSIKDALYRRRNRLSEDVRRNWFPVEKLSEKWSHLALPTQSLAEKVIQQRLSEKPSLAAHSFYPSTHSKSEEAIQ